MINAILRSSDGWKRERSLAPEGFPASFDRQYRAHCTQGGEGQQHQQHRYSGEKGPEGRDELVIQPGYDQGGDDAQRDADELHQAVGKAAPCACRGGIHQQKAVGSREGTEYDEETVGLPYEHPHRAGDFF